MSDTVTIPGGTAVLREKLTVRQRRPLIAASVTMSSDLQRRIQDAPEDANGDVAMSDANLTEAEADLMLRMQELTVVAFLESWSLLDEAGEPVPIPTMETLGDIDSEVFDVLSVAVASRGAKEINGIGDTTPDAVKDPESPTGPLST